MRKRNRLQNYNYSADGFYFITICVDGRRELFGEIKDGQTILNEDGKIVERQWLWLAQHFDFIKLDEFIVMPNHVHGILVIDRVDTRRDNPRVVPTDVPTVQNGYLRRHNLLSKTINAFKTTTSKIIRQSGLIDFQWQRSFYDHIIRKEEALDKIRWYIINNPVRWDLDRNNKENILF